MNFALNYFKKYYNQKNKNENYNAETEIDSIIKQLKTDANQMLQNQNSSLLRSKVQHLKFEIEKIEEKIKNKITSIDNIIFYLFDILNKIYSHLYDYHRNSNLNNDDMSNVNDELISLCRAAFRIYNKYLVYDSQCLNIMINQILNLGSLTVNEKLYQEFSNHDYEEFINIYANSKQRDKFSKNKLLLEREVKGVQTQELIQKENKLKTSDKTEKTNNEKINKTDESNTILLGEAIIILKNDLSLIIQKPLDLIRIDKIQNLHIDLEKIEISLNNKTNSIKSIASWLLTDLNLIYYELYDHYRNVTITAYKNNSLSKCKSKLDEMCRLGVRLNSIYLSDEPRSLNFMINIILNNHFKLILDEKSMEDFSQNSLSEYERFIEKYGNPEQNKNFAKLKRKFLLKWEMGNSKTQAVDTNKCSMCNSDFNIYIYHCLTCPSTFRICSRCFEEHKSKDAHQANHPVVRYDEEFDGHLFGEQFTLDEITLDALDDRFRNESHANTKCDSCSIEPIKGLRFKCDLCYDYNLCSNCFKTKKMSKDHSCDHPMIVIGRAEDLIIDESEIELIGDPIGQGGFGTVYKARYKKLDKIVACKFFIFDELRRSILVMDPVVLLTSFVRELAAFKEVKGDNVHRLIGHSSLDKIDTKQKSFQLMLITEFMDKGSLASLLENEPDLSYRIRLRIAIGICSGMARIHDLNFIHRDIRPDNVLIDKNYTAKIAGMEVAKVYDKNARKHTLVGCRIYMPPEFATGKYSKKLDIYTFGLTLNELYGGRHEIDERKRKIVLTKKTPVFFDLVQKCIDDKPEKRPEARQLENDLRSYEDKINEAIDRESYKQLNGRERNDLFIKIYEEIEI